MLDIGSDPCAASLIAQYEALGWKLVLVVNKGAVEIRWTPGMRQTGMTRSAACQHQAEEKNMKVNRKVLSESLGLSQATISRALNGYNNVAGDGAP